MRVRLLGGCIPSRILPAVFLASFLAVPAARSQTPEPVGYEVSERQALNDGDEFDLSLAELLAKGRSIFEAEWTPQEGGGRPAMTGAGQPLASPESQLVFPYNFNRVSGRDSNSCSGCHSKPFGFIGGGGAFNDGVFVGAERFDYITFDHSNPQQGVAAIDEEGKFVTAETVGNFRVSPGLFGAGYIEMLARQITADLQIIRDATASGETRALVSKGISFGVISRLPDGSWDVSGVAGLPPQALAGDTPSLVIRPFHQSGTAVSLRHFTVGALNQHHGMQSVERFGYGQDPDADSFTNEITRAEVTAAVVFQATLSAPGQLIPDDIKIEEAVYYGEQIFEDIGCVGCHISRLPLDNEGWIFTEPGPYNPPDLLQAGQAETYSVDLSSDELPGVRLKPVNGVVWVRAFTDFKLHDITSGPDDPNAEHIDINSPGGSPEFFAGNRRFLTKRLWGGANEKPYFHHGKFMTLREAIEAHAGEAQGSREAFRNLTADQQSQVIEYLKTLQVLPAEFRNEITNEAGAVKTNWPPPSFFAWRFTRGGGREVPLSPPAQD
ncbi:MAG: thiol oxidoreductase [Acidobacteria bacterium]|nr:thiol oxidoreductase [Acidobacteriota bacterium]